jgi:hypothetical protein
MASHSANLNLEPVIWARLLEAQKRDISPELARYLLSIEFTDSDRERIGYLAERSSSGTLTPDEEAEYDSYLHVANVLAIMQSNAWSSEKAADPFVSPDLISYIWSRAGHRCEYCHLPSAGYPLPLDIDRLRPQLLRLENAH